MARMPGGMEPARLNPMIWYARLCGVFAAIYLIAFAAQRPGAQASPPPAMMRAVTGEMLPVSEAMQVNYLDKYKARYAAFPAVLEGTRWVDTLKGESYCTSNPRKVWTFSGDGDYGRICQKISSSDGLVYQCRAKGLFGQTYNRKYSIEFGDPLLPDWTLDRPHISLAREHRSRKVITLQMCLS